MAARKVRVLYAEDNGVNRRVMAELLAGLHLDIEMVENGAEAVAACAEHRFDLVLMDIHMPVMDGIEASRRIRSTPGPNQLTPILAVTAGGSEGDAAALAAAGIDRTIMKPIVPHVLMNAVVDALAHASE
jgi:two-component system sensor histidine kinase/response regulator